MRPRVPIPAYGYNAAGQAVQATAPSGASPTIADGDASVDVTDAGFSAGSLSIPLGGTVTWRFLGPQLHNLTLASGPEGFSSTAWWAARRSPSSSPSRGPTSSSASCTRSG